MNEAPKINEIPNDSKSIIEDSISEDLSLRKRMKIIHSNETVDLNNPKMEQLTFDRITKNVGLQHVLEDIFKLLDKKSLIDARLVNSSWKNVLDQPRFWLNKLKSERMSVCVQKSLKALTKQLDKFELPPTANGSSPIADNLSFTQDKVVKGCHK